MQINDDKYYLLVIRNEKVGCSIHLSGTNKSPCFARNRGFFLLDSVEIRPTWRSKGVRTITWTGLCRKSKALPVFDGAKRAKRDLDPFLVAPADVGID